MLQSLRAKAFVGIYGKRLHLIAARGTTLNSCLAQLVDETFLTRVLEHLDIYRSSPVELIVLLSALIGAFHQYSNSIVV